jgi:osmotically-inducible protein OsmY
MRRILVLVLTLALGSTCLSGQSDEEIQATVQKAVHAYSLSGIKSTAKDGTVSLTGSVNLCRDRLLAIDMVKRIHGVKAVEDRIEVLGPVIPDEHLKAQVDWIIANRIHRLGGFGFGSMKANVKNGVVTLSGTAARELTVPAINAIAAIPGVKELIDNVLRVPHYDYSPYGVHGVPPHVPTAQ